MVKVDHVTKRYGRTMAVHDVSFEVGGGEIFVLLGPNGSGKTTILKMMVGLLRTTAGRVVINDLDMTQSSAEARRMISYLPQRVFFPETLKSDEVIRFYARLRGLNSNGAAVALKEMGIDSVGDKFVGEYSGGMLQRLALAVAFLPKAEILIMDEPTVSLDPEGVLQFRRLVRQLKEKGKTVILATHLLSETEAIADRVAIIDQGKLVSLQSIREMKKAILPTFRFYATFLELEDSWVKVARENGASEILQDNRSLSFATQRVEDRFKVLNALVERGAQIERFGTVEPPLEEIYLKILEGSHVPEAGQAGNGPRDNKGTG